jgi:hypothetical protein
MMRERRGHVLMARLKNPESQPELGAIACVDVAADLQVRRSGRPGGWPLRSIQVTPSSRRRWCSGVISWVNLFALARKET